MTTKSNTLTESTHVDLAGISGKVYCLTRGEFKTSCNPQALKDEEGDEQSAEPIVG